MEFPDSAIQKLNRLRSQLSVLENAIAEAGVLYQEILKEVQAHQEMLANKEEEKKEAIAPKKDTNPIRK